MTAATPKPMSKGNALAMALAGKIAPSVPLKASMEVCTSITRSKNGWRASPDGRGRSVLVRSSCGELLRCQGNQTTMPSR
jgi:hypothetical protein